MGTYVLLTKISPEAMSSPSKLRKLEKEVMEKIGKHCPAVKWVSSYAVLGPHDYLDIFEAPDVMTAGKVATIIRSFGHATTETWGAIPWEGYKAVVADLD